MSDYPLKAKMWLVLARLLRSILFRGAHKLDWPVGATTVSNQPAQVVTEVNKKYSFMFSLDECWGFRIRRIRMFLGFQDPDPLVRGMARIQLRIRLRVLPFSHKGVEWTEIMLAKLDFKTKC
jgi:hypothetical protein